MSELDSMKSLVLHLAQNLVDSPDEVNMETLEEGDRTTFRLRVHPGDVGKIIGSHGRTARSLRTIISAAAMKSKRRISLDIVEI